MTNEAGAIAPVDGRFRPESIFHFEEVAKNMAWLLDRSVQKCQEDLSRIYGYSGLHEMQQVLKRPGIPGPFAPRYGYFGSDNEGWVLGQDERIFHFLFGAPRGHWREDFLASDKCFLVFEIGIFQEAAESRACFEKIRQLLSFEIPDGRWPLIHGWPLGLKSWLASSYTEPFSMAEGWQKVLPRSRYAPIECADLRWQRGMTGRVRLAEMFQILAPRVGGRKPNGMGKVAFDEFEDEASGISGTSWEGYYLVEWFVGNLSQDTGPALHQQRVNIEAFVERPSRATAAACSFVKDLKDPVGFRDRWAFECFKAALDRYTDGSKAMFQSSLYNGGIQSLFLHMDADSVEISDSGGWKLWQFNCTSSDVSPPIGASALPTLQPVIHANGSLIIPFDDHLVSMSRTDWYLGHDASEFASEGGALAFDQLYLPAVGAKHSDFAYREDTYSIVEVDDLLVAPSVSVEALKAYFVRLLDSFEDNCLPDSLGYWCETLALAYEDEDENMNRNLNGEYADYVYAPAVLLINVQGCGLTFVKAIHRNGKLISDLKPDRRKKLTPSGEALAAMVMEAVKDLAVDIVVYDSEG